MNAPASFISLPPELVTKICRDSDLEKKDLIALRSTSKTQGIHASATKEYGERKFTNLRILFTHYSLQSFVDICKHPDFGPCVRRVQLSNVHADLRGIEFLVAHETHNLRSTDPQIIKSSVAKVQSCLDRYYEEIALEESGEGQKLLESAFMFLAQYGHPLSLAIDNDESNSIGHQKLFIDENIYSGWLWMPHTKIRAPLLISSAARQRCEISEIEIKPQEFDRFRTDGDDGDSICFSGIEEELHAIGPRLKKLDLTLTAYTDAQSVKSIELILTEATHLKEFRLVCEPFDLRQSFLSGILRAVTSRSLVTVAICCGHNLPTTLIGMLTKSKLSIESLVWTGDHNGLRTIRDELSDWVAQNLTELQDLRFCEKGCCVSPPALHWYIS
ncbi:hypothetical protein D6D12_06012 [Aureobasidium pullulans]|uniref:F-box domain-containing protein n=1 Tax=Aureobasidium pullulans TaxID=5580 RepID=A0AB74JRL0_AURPU|nr:hypothetical protein D6D12_06012 [Aureobasidium pullulans]THX31972.1 hypothetical protein D6D11_09876 [Aureobasidium pullulans]